MEYIKNWVNPFITNKHKKTNYWNLWKHMSESGRIVFIGKSLSFSFLQYIVRCREAAKSEKDAIIKMYKVFDHVENISRILRVYISLFYRCMLKWFILLRERDTVIYDIVVIKGALRSFWGECSYNLRIRMRIYITCKEERSIGHER